MAREYANYGEKLSEGIEPKRSRKEAQLRCGMCGHGKAGMVAFFGWLPCNFSSLATPTEHIEAVFYEW